MFRLLNKVASFNKTDESTFIYKLFFPRQIELDPGLALDSFTNVLVLTWSEKGILSYPLNDPVEEPAVASDHCLKVF